MNGGGDGRPEAVDSAGRHDGVVVAEEDLNGGGEPEPNPATFGGRQIWQKAVRRSRRGGQEVVRRDHPGGEEGSPRELP